MKKYQEILLALATSHDIIPKNDPRIESYREDTMHRGDPDAVVRARDEREVKEVLQFCFEHRIPVTICGSQTSMTGASVAEEGLLLSTERLEGLISLDQDTRGTTATFRGGTITADVQRLVEEAGYFYPVAPTSRESCRIAANVATNASGEDSYKYGPCRTYVRRLKVLLADGSERVIERPRDHIPSQERNRAGYMLQGAQPLDLFIGSEGTLGLITEVTLDLLPRSPSFFAMLLPFSDQRKGLHALIDLTQKRTQSLRALEFVDDEACRTMKTHPDFPPALREARALIYLKQEWRDERERAQLLSWWCEWIEKQGENAEIAFVATTEKKRKMLQAFRHHIPKTVNEEARKYWSQGGGKIGSDWWVPVKHLMEITDFFYTEVAKAGLRGMAYAHMGSGHPHTNIVTKNREEYQKGMQILRKCCEKAVFFGGGVAGEHGIGKIHRDLLCIQHSSAMISQMKKWKQEYDSHFLLGRGNLFDVV